MYLLKSNTGYLSLKIYFNVKLAEFKVQLKIINITKRIYNVNDIIAFRLRN